MKSLLMTPAEARAAAVCAWCDQRIAARDLVSVRGLSWHLRCYHDVPREQRMERAAAAGGGR